MRERKILSAMIALVWAASASAQVIDDFESYTDTAELEAIWPLTTLDEVTPNHVSGTQSLRREGFTAGSGAGLFTSRSFDPPIDLSGLAGLEAWVRRDPASVSPLQPAIFVRDQDGASCAPAGVPLIADSEWHRSFLSFGEFCNAVDLSAIVEIVLNISNQSGGPGDVVANFDDLAVPLFFDGFESGDTSWWSATIP